jgi:hypothetical protein
MRYPAEYYQMRQLIAMHLTNLRPAQIDGLALWVYGTIRAGSACESAVLNSLAAAADCGAGFGSADSLRQRLREWLRDGKHKAAPCKTQVELSACFPELLRWALCWWQGRQVALAIDATSRKDKLTVLCISLLYRSSAIPLAWHVTVGNNKGPWIAPLLALLSKLATAMPKQLEVLVLTDRGLNSRGLWFKLLELGWHPLMRQAANVTFRPAGQQRVKASSLVRGPGAAWVGRGVLGAAKHHQRKGTLLVVWGAEQKEPWVLLSNIAVSKHSTSWYSLRSWIESGIRALKSHGWQWHKSQRSDTTRVGRHWLVMAVATLLALGFGTRSEDAQAAGVSARALCEPRRARQSTLSRDRAVSVFKRGAALLREMLGRGELWAQVWLQPEPWPAPFSDVTVVVHASP